VVSTILERDSKQVVRALDSVHGLSPQPGTHARLENLYRGDPRTALGLPFLSVDVPSPLGPLPEWVIPGSGSVWAIVVHGYGGSRQDGLQWLPTLHGGAIPTLVVSYRNDLGAPKGPSGLVHFGQTEWHDLDPAVGYARAHGARGVVLIGQSMGGATVAEYVRHSAQAQFVRALILDAPALDLGTDMRFGAESHGLRGPFNWLVIGAGRLAMRLRAGTDFADLNELAHAKTFNLPILLYQGDADRAVPVSGADTLARARPDLVTYVRVHGAGHGEAYNVDPTRYDEALRAFLAKVM
jgi:pimeloyl-ACP methyl ester carboxylesterase